LTTAFGSSSGNGFNYMLINPNLYDEEPHSMDEQHHLEDAYQLPKSMNNLSLSVSSGFAFQ
jgi:uncharacterized protein YfkK (UPF0435 family)